MQTLLHYFLHLGFPLLVARLCFRERWWRAYLVLLASMAIDLDHLLADPVFQADRCSVGLHPLHTLPAVVGYGVLLCFRRPYRTLGVGLLLHVLTDLLDCVMTYRRCPACLADAPAEALVRSLVG
ncbi:MAG: DUF6122 family protein, partial [Catalinimonas sp.]